MSEKKGFYDTIKDAAQSKIAQAALALGMVTGCGEIDDQKPSPGMYQLDAMDGTTLDGTVYQIHEQALSSLECKPNYKKVIEGVTEFNIGVDGTNRVFSYVKDGKFYYIVVNDDDKASDNAIQAFEKKEEKVLELKDKYGDPAQNILTGVVKNGQIHYTVAEDGALILTTTLTNNNNTYSANEASKGPTSTSNLALDECNNSTLVESINQQSIDSQDNLKTYKGLTVCGSAHVPDCNTAVVSRYEATKFGPDLQCRPVLESSITKLPNSLKFIQGPGVGLDGKKRNVENTRIHKDKMFYLVSDANGTYSVEYCTFPTDTPPIDAGSTDTEADTTDTNQPDTSQEDTFDAGSTDSTDATDTEDSTNDTANDTTQEDTTDTSTDTQEQDTTPDTTPDTISKDTADAANDATQDTQADTNKPDTIPEDTFNPNISKAIEFTQGNCTIKVQPISAGSLNGEFVEINGDGSESCLANVWYSMDGKKSETPMTYKFENDKEGNIKVVCEFYPKTAPNCDVKSSDTAFHLTEKGQQTSGRVDGAVVASKASNWKLVSRENTAAPDQRMFEVVSNNSPDEPPVVVTSEKDGFTFNVPSNGLTYLINVKTGEAHAKLPDIPEFDGSSTADITIEKDAGADSTADAGSTVTPPKPKDPGGCSVVNPHAPISGSGAMAALLMAAGAALFASRKRKRA